MPPDRDAELMVLLKALSDPTRLKIVKLLGRRGHAVCVNMLAASLGITQSAVSQHLRILRQAGLVEAERMGNFVHYSLNGRRIGKFREMLDKSLA